jgi:hypothetical protein
VPGGVLGGLLGSGAVFLPLLPPEAGVGEGGLGGRTRLRPSAAPPAYAAPKDWLLGCTNEGFSFREWQIDDLARAAIRDGFILGWATGLGKGLALYIWPLLKVGWAATTTGLVPKEPVLIVAIGDLHQQFRNEAQRRLGVRPTTLDRNTRTIRPGFYLTSFTELTGRDHVMELAAQFPCIAVDEATKIKGETTFIGEQVRSIDPPAPKRRGWANRRANTAPRGGSDGVASGSDLPGHPGD